MEQLKYKDIKLLKEQLYKDQNGICPILNQKFDVSDFCIDHQHSTSKEKIGVNGAGLCRGCIHLQANSFEGKVTNAFKRYGLYKFDLSLPEVLRNLADYLEQDNLPYIHPSEKKKLIKKLTKRSYNALKRVYKGNKQFPPYPKTKILSKPLKILYEKYSIEPEFYSK